MRKLIGVAVLVFGVLVLGLFAGTRPAHRIEQAIAAEAQQAVQGSLHGLRAKVRGRDIILEGLADGEAELARVMAALDAVEGRRVLRSRAEILETATPFRLHGRRGPHGSTWEGDVPREAVRAELAAVIGADSAAGLTLAAGAPDAAWGRAAEAAATALAKLEQGEVVLEDRAITLTGEARTPAELGAAQTALAALPEGYTAQLGVDTLDDGKPFALDIEAEGGNATWRAGKLPAALDPLDLDTAYGAPIAGDIVSSRIGEDAQEWAAAAEAGLAALAQLMKGRLRIEGHTLGLTGLARDPSGAAAARAELEGLPEGFSPLVDLKLNDDGQPFALNLKKTAAGIEASGKLPAAMAEDDLAALAGEALQGDLAVARIEPQEEVFSGVARASLRAVALLRSADVTLDAQGLTFDGMAATPEEAARARAELDAAPGGMAMAIRIDALDDGRPFALTVEKPEAGAWIASGKVPEALAGFDYAAAAGVDALETDGLVVARIGADATGFAAAVAPGLTALAALNAGRMELRADRLVLSGQAEDPEAAASAEAALAALPGGIVPELALELADDGRPPAFVFDYAVATGGRLAGKLPAGLTAPEIAALVGLDGLAGDPGRARRDSSGGAAMRAALGGLAPWLGQIETVSLELTPEGALEARVVASPGVDGALLRKRLGEATGAAVTLTVAPPPEPGASRANPATGGQQRASGGFWLPVLEVETSVAGCTAATEAALAGAPIGFVTGSFRLDAASFAAVNAVAAVALPCTRAGLVLELGGHTDASGNAASNTALATRRAQVVAQALQARGVPGGALRAVGYGATVPVAGNDSPAGRAANRRTTLTWIE